MNEQAREKDRARERSVGNLERLYTVVISLAIAESLGRLFSDFGNTGQFPGFAAFVVSYCLLITVVPFYHGANRYLDATYVLGERNAKPIALMIDFVAMLSEAITFFVLALLTRRTRDFFILFALLLLMDVIWVGITRLTAPSKKDRAPYAPWAVVNLIAAVAVLLLVWLGSIIRPGWLTQVFPNALLVVIATIRTFLDYWTVWSFYYPPTDASPYIMPVPRPAPVPTHQTSDDGKAQIDGSSQNR